MKLARYEITANGAILNASSPNGMPEGMLPSGVNNSWREGQASVSRFYKDLQGLSAGGSSSAYTVTTKESEAGSAMATGEAALLAINVTNKNAAGVTLSVDGMAAKAITTGDNAQLNDGDLTANSVALVAWNGANDTWQLLSERATTDAVRENQTASFQQEVTFEHSAVFQSAIHTQAAQFPTGINSVQYMDNLALAASVAGNNLTIDVRGKDLADPSTTNRVNVSFRSETLTDGDFDVVSITSALDITVVAGATLGYSNDADGYIYVYLINNSGTAEIAVAKKAVFDESVLHSTTAMTAASDSDNVLYSTTARSNVPVRLIGRIRVEFGVGVWDNAPTEIAIWHPNMKKTGDIVQHLIEISSGATTHTTTIPLDTTPPLISEGEQLMELTVTPIGSINKFICKTQVFAGASSDTRSVASLHIGSATSVAAVTCDNVATEEFLTMTHPHTGTGAASISFQLRGGLSTAGTFRFNGVGGIFGGAANSFIEVIEFQA